VSREGNGNSLWYIIVRAEEGRAVRGLEKGASYFLFWEWRTPQNGNKALRVAAGHVFISFKCQSTPLGQALHTHL